jgi:hypothetical protein
MDATTTDQGNLVPAEVPQYYLPIRGAVPTGPQLVYQAAVLAAATVGFVNTSSGVSTSTRIRRMAAAPESSLALDWDKATTLEPTLEELDRQPYTGATLAPVTAAMTKVASYRAWGNDFSDWVFRVQTLDVLKSATYDLASNPGETEEMFRARLQSAAEAAKKEALDKLQKDYASDKATLEQKLLRAEQAKEREAEQSRGRRMQTVISFVATLLRAFTGKKKLSTGTLDRATTTMRDVGRSVDEAGDVKRAEETVEAVKQKLADLETRLQTDTEALNAKFDPKNEVLEKVLVRPRKSDITVDALGVVWMPYWKDANGAMTGAWG